MSGERASLKRRPALNGFEAIFLSISGDGEHLNTSYEWATYLRALMEAGLVRADERDALQDVWNDAARRARTSGSDATVGFTYEDFRRAATELNRRPHHARMDALVNSLSEQAETLRAMVSEWGVDALTAGEARALLGHLNALGARQAALTAAARRQQRRNAALLRNHVVRAAFWEPVARHGGPTALRSVLGTAPSPVATQQSEAPRTEALLRRRQLRPDVMRVSVLPLVSPYMTALLRRETARLGALAEERISGAAPTRGEASRLPRVDARYGALSTDTLGHVAPARSGGPGDRSPVRLFTVDLGAAAAAIKRAQEVETSSDPEGGKRGVRFMARGRDSKAVVAADPDPDAAALAGDAAVEVVCIPRALCGLDATNTALRIYLLHRELIGSPYFPDVRGLDDAGCPGVSMLLYSHVPTISWATCIRRGGFFTPDSPLFAFWARAACRALADLSALCTHRLTAPPTLSCFFAAEMGSRVLLGNLSVGDAVRGTHRSDPDYFRSRESELVRALGSVLCGLLGISLDPGTGRIERHPAWLVARGVPGALSETLESVHASLGHVVSTAATDPLPHDGSGDEDRGPRTAAEITLRPLVGERCSVVLPALRAPARAEGRLGGSAPGSGEEARAEALAGALEECGWVRVRGAGVRVVGVRGVARGGASELVRQCTGWSGPLWRGDEDAAKEEEEVSVLTFITDRPGVATIAIAGNALRGASSSARERRPEGRGPPTSREIELCIRPRRECVPDGVAACIRVCFGVGKEDGASDGEALRQASFAQLLAHPVFSAEHGALTDAALEEYETRFGAIDAE